MKHVTHYKSSPSGKKGGSFSLTGRLKGGFKFLLLTIMLCLASGAWAADLTGSGTEADPYLIRNATDWAEFCTNTSKYHESTVKLTIDLTISRRPGVFYGVFDGGYHTITVGYSTDYIFQSLQGNPVGIESPTLTIRNVHFKTAQNVSLTGDYLTGLVRATNGPRNELCFENVTNSMSIQCSNGFAGAFVGSCNSPVTFRSCVFDGTIITTGNPIVGGFAYVNNGDVKVTMEYCAMAGNITGTTTNRALIIRTAGKTNPITANHCCYIPRVDTEHIIGNNTWEAACTATGFRSISQYADGTMCGIVGCHPYPNGGNCVHCTEYGTEKTVYSIATLDDWHWFITDSHWKNHDKYQLTNDLTITEKLPANYENPFYRIFDGLEHSITFASDYPGNGIFDTVKGMTDGSDNVVKESVIKNLIIAGTITRAANYFGSVTGGLHKGGVIQNCVSKVVLNVQNHPSAGALGGLVSDMRGGKILNCAYYGKINFSGNQTCLVGGIAGQISAHSEKGSDCTVAYCFVDAKILSTSGYYTIGHRNQAHTFHLDVNNCYGVGFQSNFKKYGEGETESSPWDALWGFTCYCLNGGNTTDPVWYQDLSQDWTDDTQEWRPMPFYKYGATVYKNLRADDTDYAYTNSSVGRSLTVNGGYCQIGSTQDMMDFANCVNGMGKDLKAKLTADVSVDMTKPECGQNKWISLACHNDEKHRFKGEIDGQGHTLNVNLPYNYANTSNFGLINNVAETNVAEAGASIRNIKLSGYIGNEDGYKYVGTEEKYTDLGIVGRSDGNLTFQNVTNSLHINGGTSGIAGFVGYFAGVTDNDAKEGNSTLTFINCLFDESVNSKNADPAGFVGWVKDGNTVVAKNILNIGDITPKPDKGSTNAFFKYNDNKINLTCSNLYYKNSFNTIKPATVNDKVTDAQLASGEVCWKLGSDVLADRGGSEGVAHVWRQNLSASEAAPHIKWNGTANDKEATQVVNDQLSIKAALGYTTLLPRTKSTLPNDINIKAYIITTYGEAGALSLSRIYTLKVNQPVLLQGDENSKSVYANLTNDEEIQVEGLLVGVKEKTTLTGIDNPNCYVLGSKNSKVAFYRVGSQAQNVSAYKAYLQLPSNMQGITAFYFDEDSETGIQTIFDESAQDEDNEIYNLAGQRINQMQRGVNIINGKKIIK